MEISSNVYFFKVTQKSPKYICNTANDMRMNVKTSNLNWVNKKLVVCQMTILVHAFENKVEYFRVDTGQAKVMEISHVLAKVREICSGSVNFEILKQVGAIWQNPQKVREN